MSLLSILTAILPIFVVIVLGHLLRRGGIPNTEFWDQNDRLVYWVLMPALLFTQCSTAEISADLVGSYALVILSGFVAALAFGLGSARLAGLDEGATGAVMQCSARHNIFISLSVAGTLFGAEGLALASLGAALLIPVTNLCVVPLLIWLHRHDAEGGVAKAMARDLGRNPLLIAVVLGAAWNAAGIGEVPVLHQSTGVIGAAALPIVLMCIGANLRVRAMRAAALPLVLSAIGKFLVFPFVTIGLALWLDLTRQETLVALLFAAAPVATAAYAQAKQMGGDAPLTAAMTTIQTAMALITLPLSIITVEALFQ